MSTRYSHSFTVGHDSIDFMGHANNAHYLQWVQEGVLAHWRKFAPDRAATESLWVALKHEITYRRPAFLDDELIAEIMLEKVEGAKALYSTVIRRGEKVLAEVTSTWCCIDAESLRPKRIAQEIANHFFGSKSD